MLTETVFEPLTGESPHSFAMRIIGEVHAERKAVRACYYGEEFSVNSYDTIDDVIRLIKILRR